MDKIETILLETLSFFDEMSLEQILMQMDRDTIEMHPDLDMGHLEDALKHLKRRGLVVQKGKGKDALWKKKFRHKRSWFSRLFLFWR